MPINEDRWLAALFPRLGVGPEVSIPPGDDCAALPWRDGQLLLLAVDQVAAEVHYHGPRTAAPTPAALVGRKLLARNLSDIAAMGGRPTYALLAIATPRDTTEAWLDAFMDGLLELARSTGVQLIGGDLGAAKGGGVASLTILGEVAETQVVRRRGAQPGDLLFGTGQFGGSLLSGRHLTFPPRLAEGAWLAEHGYARAMLDVSDGLLKDLSRLCRASDVSAQLDLPAIPRMQVGGVDFPLAAALTDGEDYELLFAVAPARAAELRRAWPFPTPLTSFGTFTAPGAPALITDARGLDLLQNFGPGFEHFRGK